MGSRTGRLLRSGASPEGRTTRGDQGHLMLGERILPQSEVIRAIVLEGSPCCGVRHLAEYLELVEDLLLLGGQVRVGDAGVEHLEGELVLPVEAAAATTWTIFKQDGPNHLGL